MKVEEEKQILNKKLYPELYKTLRKFNSNELYVLYCWMQKRFDILEKMEWKDCPSCRPKGKFISRTPANQIPGTCSVCNGREKIQRQ